AWNTANDGNAWTLTAAPPAKANITIQEADPGAGNDGLSTPTVKSTGLFGLGSGEVNSVSVAIRPGLGAARRATVILHELGHCLRLDHTPGANDVMNSPAAANPAAPSAGDVAEALASDKDP